MSHSRSLTYLSAKSVLQFLDANLRIELRQRCPGIRSTDSIVPLKIDELQLTPTMIRINQKTYRLCLYECYWNCVEKIPEGVLNKRKLSRERDHDVDQYGIRDESIDLISGDQNIDFAERLRQDLDIEHSKDMYYRSKYLLSIEKHPVEMKALKERIDHYGSIYYPYLLREKETEREQIPYLYCIKLMAGEKMEIVEYNKKLGNALKYLIEYLFGKKKSIVIQNLEINSTAPFRYKLPNNLSVCNLKITEQAEKALNAFSFTTPLEKLEILEKPSESVDYSNPIIRESKILLVNGGFTREHLQQITNPRVIFSKQTCDSILYEVVETLIEKWRRVQPVIGTHFVFGTSEHFYERGFLKDLEDIDGAKKGRLPDTSDMRMKQSVDFELDEKLEVSVFYQKKRVQLVVHRK